MISVRIIQKTITFFLWFLSEWSNNIVNSYDFCQTDAKTIEIHDFCKNGAKQVVNSYDLS